MFERYNITDQSDTQEAGRLAAEFLERNTRRICRKIGHKDGKAKLMRSAKPFRIYGAERGT